MNTSLIAESNNKVLTNEAFKNLDLKSIGLSQIDFDKVLETPENYSDLINVLKTPENDVLRAYNKVKKYYEELIN